MLKKLETYGVNTKSNAFKRYYNANLLKELDFEFLEEIKEYWNNHYNKNIDPINHLAFMNLTGKKEVRIMPNSEMWNEIIPFFNDMTVRPGYSDKNIYDILLDTDSRPKTVLKCVHGNYFDQDNNDLNREMAEKALLSMKQDLIIKPSNRDNGQGINKLYYRQSCLYLNNKKINIFDLEKNMGKNFIVQTIIEQHPLMAAPHPASVNTLRMVTFRWKGEITHLLTYARFGGGNNIKDHAIAGGVSVSVDDDGLLGSYGLDTYAVVHSHHPTTNFSFKNNRIQIPNYNEFKKFVIDLHKNILHHDYVSWDIAVGSDGQPIVIEPNFRGTTWRYQLASKKPIFGDLTEEVLLFVSNELNNKNGYVRSQEFKDNRRLKRQVKRLSRKNYSLNKQLINYKRKVEQTGKYINYIHSSKSWKLTSPLRKMMKKIKK